MAPGGSGSHNGGRELLPFVEKHLTKSSERNPTTKKYAGDTEGPETLSPGEVAEEFERFEAQQREAEAACVRGRTVQRLGVRLFLENTGGSIRRSTFEHAEKSTAICQHCS